VKVVYFDYWINGIRNFVPLNESLVEAGHKTMLFHIGSFRDRKCDEECIVDGILCHDIKYYKTKFIFNALKKINPDVIVTLNTTYILDRALILSCKKLNIKTVFMMHGERPIDNDIDTTIKKMQFSLKSKILKSKKYLLTVIPNYIISSWHFNKRNILIMRPIKVLWLIFKNPGLSNFYPPFSNELIHNTCLVYAKKYINYYQKLGYNKSQIVVVGDSKNEKLFQLIEEKFPLKRMLNSDLNKVISSGNKYALYLEDSIQEDNSLRVGLGWSYQYLGRQLADIEKRLKKDNIKLVVKLHPCTDKNKIPKFNSEIIFAESDLEHLIYYSTFCIGNISSTINMAVMLNKPILIPFWGKSKMLPDYYVKHNVANHWINLEDDFDLRIDLEARKEYYEENITELSKDSIDLALKEIIDI
jgi:hypothetical protein